MKSSTSSSPEWCARLDILCVSWHLMVCVRWSIGCIPSHRIASTLHPAVAKQTTFTCRIIPELAQEARTWSEQQLRNAKNVTLQTDPWTTTQGRSVRAHLAITDQREVVVVIVHAPDRTDAQMVAQDMQETIMMVDTLSPSMLPDSIASRRSNGD
jgi:hypothetical protein